MFNAKEPNGLWSPPATTSSTWVLITVVLTSECPSNSCRVWILVPDCNNYVATMTCLSLVSTPTKRSISRLPHIFRTLQTVAFHKHAQPMHIGLFGAQAIVFVTNLLTGSRSRLARNTGEATGFMAEFHALFYTNCRYQKQAKSHFIFYFSQCNIQ